VFTDIRWQLDFIFEKPGPVFFSIRPSFFLIQAQFFSQPGLVFLKTSSSFLKTAGTFAFNQPLILFEISPCSSKPPAGLTKRGLVELSDRPEGSYFSFLLINFKVRRQNLMFERSSVGPISRAGRPSQIGEMLILPKPLPTPPESGYNRIRDLNQNNHRFNSRISR
jgi:hypothetical protein